MKKLIILTSINILLALVGYGSPDSPRYPRFKVSSRAVDQLPTIPEDPLENNYNTSNAQSDSSENTFTNPQHLGEGYELDNDSFNRNDHNQRELLIIIAYFHELLHKLL